MKKTIITLVGVMSLAVSAFASNNAELIFDNKCSMCHKKIMPKDKSNMIAPALVGVMRHLKMTYPNKEDAIRFMVDYVQYPSKEKAICMPQKIARFGVMPSQKGNITPQELKEVSAWMFDNFPAANFRARGMQQGGGMSQGMKGMQNRPTFATFDTNGDGVITEKEFNNAQKLRMQSKMGGMKNSSN